MSNQDWQDDDKFLGAFGALINAMGGGGNRGNMFPASDSDDMMNGARFIPGEVTMARRQGENVKFVQTCGKCCWYWEFQDGTRIYYWDRPTWESIARHNGHTEDEITGDAGACPNCGNTHTNGGTVKPE